MLKVPAPSPPVPHVSRASGRGRGSGTARARIVRAKPTISAGRSPFCRSAISRPAICAAGTSPSMMRGHRRGRLGLGRGPPCRCSFSSSAGEHHSSRKLRRSRRPSSVRIDSGWNCTPCIGHSRWRSAITVRSSSSVRAAISSTAGQPSSDDDQRVVARGRERRGQAGEDALAVVLDRRASCRASAAARARRCRRTPRPSPDGRDRRRGSARDAPKRWIAAIETPASSGRPGPGRDHDPRRRQRRDLVERDLRRCGAPTPRRRARPGTARG